MSLFTITFDDSDSDSAGNAQTKPTLPQENRNARISRQSPHQPPSTVVVRKKDLSAEPLPPPMAKQKNHKPRPPIIEEEEEEEEEIVQKPPLRKRKKNSHEQHPPVLRNKVVYEPDDNKEEEITENKTEENEPPQETNESNDSARVAEVPRVELKELEEYILHRVQKIEWRGKSMLFVMSQNGRPLFNTKLEPGKSDILLIKDGELYKEGITKGCILINPERNNFALRADTQFGDELISIRITATQNEPRIFRFYLFYIPRGSGYPVKLMNRRIDSKLLFENDPSVLPSIKNVILEDDIKREFALVKKIEKNKIKIEAEPGITPLCVFTLGISSFLAK